MCGKMSERARQTPKVCSTLQKQKVISHHRCRNNSTRGTESTHTHVHRIHCTDPSQISKWINLPKRITNEMKENYTRYSGRTIYVVNSHGVQSESTISRTYQMYLLFTVTGLRPRRYTLRMGREGGMSDWDTPRQMPLCPCDDRARSFYVQFCTRTTYTVPQSIHMSAEIIEASWRRSRSRNRRKKNNIQLQLNRPANNTFLNFKLFI